MVYPRKRASLAAVFASVNDLLRSDKRGSIPSDLRPILERLSLNNAREMIKEAVGLLIESYRDNAKRDATGRVIWESLTVDLPPAA